MTSIKRKVTGLVVSNKMQKTVIVKVASVKVHPKYHKRYTVFNKFAAHAPEGEFKIGDKVEIEESRPLSKTKSWIVTKKV